jgi:exonuclease III
MDSGHILVWNARGLNGRSHHNALRELVAAQKPMVVCIQETKLHVISSYDLCQILGNGFSYVYLPTVKMRGGYLGALAG